MAAAGAVAGAAFPGGEDAMPGAGVAGGAGAAFGVGSRHFPRCRRRCRTGRRSLRTVGVHESAAPATSLQRHKDQGAHGKTMIAHLLLHNLVRAR